jgi:hypothetical protein
MLIRRVRKETVQHPPNKTGLVVFVVVAGVVVELACAKRSKAFRVEGARIESGDPVRRRLNDLPSPPRRSTSSISRSP